MAIQIDTEYKTGLKREIVNAARSVFSNLPHEEFKGIYVGLEYPQREAELPAIFVTYSEGPIQNVGVGHYGQGTDERGVPYTYKHSRFEGQLNFNLLADNPVDRDKLSAVVINMLQHGQVIAPYKSFHDEISDNDYIMIHLMTDYISPGGETVGDAPWGEDAGITRVFGSQYSVRVYGEFFSDAYTGGLIQISAVNVYPYRPWEQPPW